jgi:hypothetical protein
MARAGIETEYDLLIERVFEMDAQWADMALHDDKCSTDRELLHSLMKLLNNMQRMDTVGRPSKAHRDREACMASSETPASSAVVKDDEHGLATPPPIRKAVVRARRKASACVSSPNSMFDEGSLSPGSMNINMMLRTLKSCSKVDPSLGETCTLTGDGHEKIPPATRRPALVARGGRNLSWLQRERDRVTFSSDLEEVRVFKTDSWDRDEEAS